MMNLPDSTRLAAFARGRLKVPPGTSVEVDVRLLAGGLQAAAVGEVRARAARNGRATRDTFIVKCLAGAQQREARVYEWLQHSDGAAMAPRLLGQEQVPDGGLYLYLERVRPHAPWPWAQRDAAGRVVDRLAALHGTVPRARFQELVPDWAYDAELTARAALTRGALEHADRTGSMPGVRPLLAPVRRVSDALPALRRQMASATALGETVLHGDVHAGNVLLRATGAHEPVLLDWERAREGSPLEDVSSWLQSLAHWEPEVRRRHDTLLERYLRARGMSGQPGRALRQAYWLAAASNAFAGALLHHVSEAIAAYQVRPSDHARAAACARDWLRMIRRADALWRA